MTMLRFPSVREHASVWIAASMLLTVAAAARAEPVTQGTIVSVTQALCDDMKKHNVIRAGAIVGCERLKLIKVPYVGFDGATRTDGEIMVMDAAAENVLRIFARLRDMGFPIAKARLINHRSEERRVGKEGRSRWSPYH